MTEEYSLELFLRALVSSLVRLGVLTFCRWWRGFELRANMTTQIDREDLGRLKAYDKYDI
jgi:hypothetical protein